MEVRKESGDPYTPRSIVQLMSGLNRKISLDESGVNIMDSKCPSFQPLHTVLDNFLDHSTARALEQCVNREDCSPLKKKIDCGSSSTQLSLIIFLHLMVSS